MTASAARELISTSVISARETHARAPVSLVEDQAPSISQNGWLRQGGPPGQTPVTRQWSWPWTGNPTTFVTVATTVTDTKPPPTTEIFLTPAPSPTASLRNSTGGIDISGPVAAGIGAAASVGLFVIGIAVALFCTKCSRRRKGQSSAGQASGSEEIVSDIAWPPYLYSASNDDSAVELSATRQPKEMCAETRPQEKDVSKPASNYSGIAGFDGESPVFRGEDYGGL
ncbi:hypothetical protein F5X97DRAFT_296861 [Nemania serpens]|nr:hypothetical protein F5X97DRAFT_296861 [Nemania serpens]